MFFIDKVLAASAREGEGAGRGPGGLRNSELGSLPHYKRFLRICLKDFRACSCNAGCRLLQSQCGNQAR